MALLRIFGTLLLAAMSSAACAQAGTEHNYVPPAGYVPDARTAIRIAEAVLLPIYGEKIIDGQRPLGAVLDGDTWTVTGAPLPPDWRGGVAIVVISRHTAQILRVSHGK